MIEGEELPPLAREITTTTVVAAAVASRDFYPAHHDSRFARQAGIRDVFINIITTGGFVGKYLTDWSGPEGEITWMKFRLKVPCCAGDTLTMTGKVARKYGDAGQHLVDVEYNLAVRDGTHCAGVASMTMPAKDG